MLNGLLKLFDLGYKEKQLLNQKIENEFGIELFFNNNLIS